MSAVSFVTPGLIDLRCITTMGVSVKTNDNPIGMFGTGLKYAIAIVLARGGSVTLWRGSERIKFGVQATDIRGKTVGIITMNGDELGFTTHLGAHWEMWQAFRELYSNTLDERGTAEEGEHEPASDATSIIIDQPEFAQCYRERAKYFISGTPIYCSPEVDFYPQSGRVTFYRGIAAATTRELPWRYTPNIKTDLQLTEDRTLADTGQVDQAIGKAIAASRDEQWLTRYLQVDKRHQEFATDLYWFQTPSAEFLSAFRALHERNVIMNRTARHMYDRHAAKLIPPAAVLLPHEREMLDKAIAISTEMGFDVTAYKITVVNDLGARILGTVDKDDSRIILSRMAFRMGDSMVASTLIEEWVHLRYGYADNTRDMQNWLFDQLLHFGRAYLGARQ